MNEKFKKAIKNLSIDQLKQKLEDRKKMLLKWNVPAIKYTATGKEQLPYKKVKKEIAILNTIIKENGK